MIPFVSRGSHDEQMLWIEELARVLPSENVVPLEALSEKEKQQCDIAIVANPDPQVLLELPNLVWVHSVWAGIDRMLEELKQPSFSIVRMIDPELAKTMSEAVLAWTLYLHRDMPFYAQQQQDKKWHQRTLVRAQERRVAILGLGELGQVCAKRLIDNGFVVSGWSRREKKLDRVRCYSGDQGLIDILQEADIVVCLLPLTEQTRNILDQKALALLPKGAKLINFARGPLINEVALLSALEHEHIAHAVLDVFYHEPLPVDHVFWDHPNITVLPHISAPTCIHSACCIVAQAVRDYRESGVVTNPINISLGY